MGIAILVDVVTPPPGPSGWGLLAHAGGSSGGWDKGTGNQFRGKGTRFHPYALH